MAEIEVVGLKELRAGLRQAGPQFPKQLQQANKRVVNQVLVPEGRRLASARGYPRPGSAVIGSIRGTATQTKAVFNVGGARVPHAMGHNFGSSGRFRQFPPKTSPDYFMYKAVSNRNDDVMEAYGDVIDELSKIAFPD